MKSVSYEQFRDVTVEFSQVSEIAIVKMSILPEFFKFSKFKMRTFSDSSEGLVIEQTRFLHHGAWSS